jgi:hypothetical protein
LDLIEMCDSRTIQSIIAKQTGMVSLSCLHVPYLLNVGMAATSRHVLTAEREIVRDIKESLAYVALDWEAEMERSAVSSECEV